MADKLSAVENASQPHDVLFLGSSKIYSGVIPEQFDRVVASHGFEVRSYNLGVDGMGHPESGFIGEKALAVSGGAVKWVFLEASNIRTFVPPNQIGTRRFTYWHDFERTRLLSETIQARIDQPIGRAVEDTKELSSLHWKAFLGRSLNFGEGAELAREKLDRPEKRKGRDVLDPALRGYVPITNEMAGTELQKFRKSLTVFRKKKKRAERLTEEAMRGFAKDAARYGAETILIGMPDPAPTPPLFADDQSAPPLFDFADPQRYPLVYREDYRGDAAHLNHAGAEAFTRYLAERFVAHLRTIPP